MTLADARAIVPNLEVVEADEAADFHLLERIADWCGRFTPFVALDPPCALLLDITGVAHLFDGEAALLDQIRAELAQRGFAVRGAIAGTAAAARALARYQNGVVAPPQKEAELIARLPVEALFLDPATTHALRRAGLKTIGQVAERRRSELTARFGSQMVFMLDHALGRVELPITPRLPTPDYRAERQFAEPVITHEGILATLASLACSLAAVMEKQGLGARRLEAVFFRSDGAVRCIAIETAAPTRDAGIIARLFREKIDALADPLDPGFGFDTIRLSASRTERVEACPSDFAAEAEQQKELHFLIDRLAARFGSERVLLFQPNNTHIPEAAFVLVPAQSAKPTQDAWVAVRSWGEAPRRPLRIFANPESVDVMAETPEGPPRQFRWRHALHTVRRVEGPERIAMEWWRHETPQPTRDYFRIEDEQGCRFWLYREGIYGRETLAPRWFLQGLFA
jgi:protein ImuB